MQKAEDSGTTVRTCNHASLDTITKAVSSNQSALISGNDDTN